MTANYFRELLSKSENSTSNYGLYYEMDRCCQEFKKEQQLLIIKLDKLREKAIKEKGIMDVNNPEFNTLLDKLNEYDQELEILGSLMKRFDYGNSQEEVISESKAQVALLNKSVKGVKK